MKYILTFILSFLSFLVCSQNITITDIPTIDQLPVNAIHRVFRFIFLEYQEKKVYMEQNLKLD